MDNLRHHFGASSDLYFKARFLGIISIGMSVSLMLLAVLFSVLGDRFLDDTTTSVFTPALGCSAILFLLNNMVLQAGYYKLAASLLVAHVSVAIIGGLMILGGFPSSVASPAIMIIPVVVFLLFGRTAGLSATFVVPAIVMTKWAVANQMGFEFPDLTSKVHPDANIVITLLFVYGIVMGVLYAYASNAAYLQEELHAERQKYINLANRDPLTGLANSRHFKSVMDGFLEAGGPPFRIMYLDLDQFKPLNDTHGHEAGDYALLTVGNRLRQYLGKDDFAARMGGDEFVLLLRTPMSEQDACDLMQTVTRAVRQPISWRGQDLHVGLSYGQARFPQEAQEREDLLRLADTRMYEAKAKAKIQRIQAAGQGSGPGSGPG